MHLSKSFLGKKPCDDDHLFAFWTRLPCPFLVFGLLIYFQHQCWSYRYDRCPKINGSMASALVASLSYMQQHLLDNHNNTSSDLGPMVFPILFSVLLFIALHPHQSERGFESTTMHCSSNIDCGKQLCGLSIEWKVHVSQPITMLHLLTLLLFPEQTSPHRAGEWENLLSRLAISTTGAQQELFTTQSDRAIWACWSFQFACYFLVHFLYRYQYLSMTVASDGMMPRQVPIVVAAYLQAMTWCDENATNRGD